MNCPKCNNVIEQGSSFCTSCGFNLNGNSNIPQEQPVMINQNQAPAVSSVPTTEPTLINNVPVASQGMQQSVVPEQNTVLQQNTVPYQNVNVTNNEMTNINQNNQQFTPVNNMNPALATTGNAMAAAKAKSNVSTIIIVVVIALVAIVACYFITNKNASSDKNTTNTNSDNSVALNDNIVTVNGLSGNVPKNWSFVSGTEVGAYSYDSVFIKDSQDSVSLLSNMSDVTYTAVKQNIVTLKAQFEAKGITNLDYKTDTKNGIEYTLFEGIYQNVNYHIFVRANGAGVLCAEGTYASASDLNTIVEFLTSLKSATGVKAIDNFTSPNFSSVILGN